MKFGVAFANSGPFAGVDLLATLGQTAEQVGLESLWTIEHVLMPVGYRAEYPYDRSGKLPGGESLDILDPLLPLAFLAAATATLRLGTGILILPHRHPAHVAKEAATLDVLSRGRAMLGVGIGWLEEEFEALGIPFQQRGPRTEESIRAIRSLWTDRPEPFEGRFYRWGAAESNPKPVQAGGVPIIVGGHVEGAARRAARLGDGFFPGRGSEKGIGRLLEVVRDECAKIGRDPGEIEVTSVLPGNDLDTIRRYEDLGVSRLVMGPPSLEEEAMASRSAADVVRRELEAFGDRVLGRL